MQKFRFYTIFIALTIVIMAMCDTLAFKAISIDGYTFAVSGILYSLSFFSASIMTEVYGYKLAGRVVWVQLFCHILFILTVNMMVLIPSPENSAIAQNYYELFHNYWRVLLGSCIAMPIAYFINDLILSKLKIILYGKIFILRFLLSNILGSAILVSISYPINFYNQFSLSEISTIAYHTWVYKVLIALILLPLGIWLTNKIKALEKLDYYDYGTSYNPMTVFSTQESGINKYATK